jgi:hypothetical protein
LRLTTLSILARRFPAIAPLVSPVPIRLWHLSDACPLWRRRREPCLILGAILSGGVALSVARLVQRPALVSGGCVPTLAERGMIA